MGHRTTLTLLALYALIAGLYIVYNRYGFSGIFLSDAGIIGIALGVLGDIYAMVLGFTILVTWNQYNTVDTRVMQEAANIRNILMFARKVDDSTYADIRERVRDYVLNGVTDEWKMLVMRQRSGAGEKRFEALFAAILDLVISSKNKDAWGKQMTLNHMLKMVEMASVYRSERMTLGLNFIPKNLVHFTNFIATLVVGMFIMHPATLIVDEIIIALMIAVVSFGYIMVIDFDNPFKGSFIVSMQPFLEILEDFKEPEERSEATT